MELLMDIKTWYANCTAASIKAQNKATAAPEINAQLLSHERSLRAHMCPSLLVLQGDFLEPGACL